MSIGGAMSGRVMRHPSDEDEPKVTWITKVDLRSTMYGIVETPYRGVYMPIPAVCCTLFRQRMNLRRGDLSRGQHLLSYQLEFV